MKKQIGSFIGGAVATAAIPATYGIVDWKILAGAAALGGIGALCGISVPSAIKKYTAKRATKTN